MKILTIETSCDETAVAVVEDGTKIISNVIASSKDMHEKYGGVVPEVAAREQLKCIIPVITEAVAVFDGGVSESMSQRINQHIDAIAVTVGPGLIGSLLVGVETAKTLAYTTGKSIIPVNHVLAHMYTNFIPSEVEGENSSRAKSRDNLIEFPAISLVVSGGHTELYLMKSVKNLMWLGGTLDDAAGECFDKTARLLGFGHGGGPAIQNAAEKFKVSRLKLKVSLPRPMINDESFNFSFSGLKTAVMREWKKQLSDPSLIPHPSSLTSTFAHEIQESITDVLVKKTLRAAKYYGAKSILLS
ncbi:hypothetical protein A2973_05680, partial [Candidatus Gottesmanbacteria bacterium RIFCSPLOWO2_01_FULL_49_10]